MLKSKVASRQVWLTVFSNMFRSILKGPQTISDKISKGLGEYLFEAAEKYGDRVFQIDPNRGITDTFSEVKKRSVKIALYLQTIGIRPGDVVTVFCKNDVDNIVPVLAAVLIGAPVSSIDLMLDLHDIKHCIYLVRPKVIFVIEEGISVLEKALNELEFDTKIVAVGASGSKYADMYDIEKGCWDGEDSFKPFTPDLKKELAFILFSSGTTSLPKGVMWSHSTVLQRAPELKRLMENNSWAMNPMIRTATFYWNSSIWNTAACIVNGRAMVILGHKYTPEVYFGIIQKHQLSSLTLINPSLCLFLAFPDEEFKTYDTSSLKEIKVTGSPIDSENILKLRRKFPNAKVFQVYGSTEIGAPSFQWPLESPHYYTKPGSCGIVCANMEAKIVDVDTGELLGPNQNGELLIKSPYVMLGFYNTPTPPQIFDDDGFLRTGDLAYYDEDGFFYVVDRINEIYKYHANRICPLIIETLLMKLPAIKEAAVVGIPHEIDENHGAACIVLNKGCSISAEEIDQYIVENLGDLYRLRRGVKFVDEIPKTPSEKFKRRAIREMFLS